MHCKVTERKEDMSPKGRLKLLIQDDGDIIVTTQGMYNGLVEPGSSVEFCTPAGGGKSPNTLAALYKLFEAMEKDNNPTILALDTPPIIKID